MASPLWNGNTVRDEDYAPEVLQKQAAPGFWFADLTTARHGTLGRLTFIVDGPVEATQVLQRMLHVQIGELKNIDIAQAARGRGGGPLLIRAMAATLEKLGIHFVLLKHLDHGSGHLVRWYEQLGFQFATQVLPPHAAVQDVLDEHHRIAELSELQRRLAAR